MPATWKLRDLLKERGGKHASEIRRIVFEQTGYQLSVQAVCNLLSRQPKMIRIETIQAICDSFYIRLSDFLEVLPSAAQEPTKKRRSLERRVRKVDDASGQGDGLPTASQSKKKVDFAAFYPDARKFSSDSTRGTNIQDRKG
jgi:DNA-binding Xre family transcriptional regulator